MNYANSSLQFSYEYELVDNSDLSTSYGYLDCVTGEPKITWSYDSELRCSATLDLDDTTQLTGYYAIRIWLIAHDTKTGETDRRMLGTFLYDRTSGMHNMGHETTTLDLYSMLYRFQADNRPNNQGVAPSTTCVSKFESVINTSFGIPRYDYANLSASKTFNKAIVWEAGASALSCLQLVADTVGGYLGVNPKGEITMERYIEPIYRPESFHLGSNNFIIDGGMQEDLPKVINHVIATYTYNDTTAGSSQSIVMNADKRLEGTTHPWDHNRLKVWFTEVIQPSTIEQDDSQAVIQQKLNNAVNQRFKELLAQTSTLTIKTLYNPAVQCGAVGTVEFVDSPNATPKRYKVVCTNIEMACNVIGEMTLTLGVLYGYN